MRILARLLIVAALIAPQAAFALDPGRVPPITLGTGSSGDGSAVSVTPSASAAPGTLARSIADQATALATKAPLASPVFTGVPSMPSLALTGSGSTGDVSGTSVTADGTTQPLSTWIPSFLRKAGGAMTGGLILPQISIGKAADSSSSWVNDNLPGAYAPGRVQQFTISPNGGFSAVVHAARTSDNTGPVDNVLSDTCLNVHDNQTVAHLNWCRYTQVNIKPGAALSLALGEEASVENRWGAPVKMDPFSSFDPGGKDIAVYRANAIGQFNNGLTYYPISTYWEANYNGQRALNGMTFAQESIADNATGQKDTIVMGVKHGFVWYGGAGAPAWRVYSSAQTANSGQIVLGNNSFDLYIGGSGERPLHIQPGQVLVNDPLIAGDVVQLKSSTFANLPASAPAGSQLYCSDCREPSQGAGAGTGITVLRNASGWRSTAGGAAAN